MEYCQGPGCIKGSCRIGFCQKSDWIWHHAAPKHQINMKDNNEFRDFLQNRRQVLVNLIVSSTDSASPVELDQQVQGRLSRMDAIQVQAMAKATAERRRIEIAQIDAAMGRMEVNEYGYCVECGEKIAEKRLRLTPSIARCIECAE